MALVEVRVLGRFLDELARGEDRADGEEDVIEESYDVETVLGLIDMLVYS
jgi:hypothetical protein